jgi:hypothetical protein
MATSSSLQGITNRHRGVTLLGIDTGGAVVERECVGTGHHSRILGSTMSLASADAALVPRPHEPRRPTAFRISMMP